ncbi:MAG: hypothetical protein MI861_28525 [Pirellulales bacterium]|nr:hypothetical protein [Pirellulales bacterium]
MNETIPTTQPARWIRCLAAGLFLFFSTGWLTRADGQQPASSSANQAPPAAPVEGVKITDTGFAELPEPLTSFGGVIVDNRLYVYGGHIGSAHSYSIAEQSDRFYSLDLDQADRWQELPSGPRLQGLALVAHDGAVYRVGGFTAMNAEGEEHQLQSQTSFARFDPDRGKWNDLPPLPEPRSSHDAAVVGDHLYVVGGWSMQPDATTKWHQTAWSIDLSKPSARWQPLTQPPFQRRALALAAHQGKLYVIGGMQADGGPTTRVDVYDPQTKGWTESASLEGDPFTGFGSAAFATGGRLYVSTIRGSLQRLSKDGGRWDTLATVDPARFFHRMLPASKNRLLLVGGANMSVGKFTEIHQVEIE